MFRLDQSKQKTNWNSLIGSIFWYFSRKFWVFLGFFGYFLFVWKQLVSVVSLQYRNREFWCFDRTKTNRRTTQTVWKGAYFIFGYFSENLGLFWFVSKQLCLFRLFRYRFETSKQTETNLDFLFLVSRNKPKHNRNGSCFGLNRNFSLVCFEDTLPATIKARLVPLGSSVPDPWHFGTVPGADPDPYPWIRTSD